MLRRGGRGSARSWWKKVLKRGKGVSLSDTGNWIVSAWFQFIRVTVELNSSRCDSCLIAVLLNLREEFFYPVLVALFVYNVVDVITRHSLALRRCAH